MFACQQVEDLLIVDLQITCENCCLPAEAATANNTGASIRIASLSVCSIESVQNTTVVRNGFPFKSLYEWFPLQVPL